MIEDNYSKAYSEVVEILKYIPEESVNKIPKEIRNMFEEKQLKSYNFQIDTEKTFEKQELLTETRAILANLYRDYLATPSQKEKILTKEKIEKEDDEKRKKYHTDSLFKNKKIERNMQIQISTNQQNFQLESSDNKKNFQLESSNNQKGFKLESNLKIFFTKVTEFFKKIFYIN